MEDFTILENLPHIGEKMFGILTIEDLFHCQLVCKAWNLFLTNPMFWLKKLKILGQSKEITKKWMELIQRSNELLLHKEAISKCLKAIFVSINTRNKTFQLNKPPIPIAIQFGVVEVLELLAEVNEDFNQQILESIVGFQSDQRKPTLHYVIQDRNHKNKLEILKFLAFKCNPNLKDCHQKTALHLAIEKRWIEAVKILVPLTDDLTEHKTILYTSGIRKIIATEKSRRGQDQPGTQSHQQIQLLTQPQMTQSLASQPHPSQPIKKKKGKKKRSKKKDQHTQKGTQPGTQTHHQIQPLTSSSLCVAMSNANIAPQTSQPQTAQLGPQPRNQLLTQTQQENQFVSQTGTHTKSRRGQAHPQTQQETQVISQSGTQPQTQPRTQQETQVVSQSETQTQQETQVVSQSGTQPRTQQETQVVSQSGTQPQTQQVTQVISQSGIQTQSRTQLESQVVSQSGTQPQTQPQTQQETQVVSQSGTQPQTQQETQVISQSGTQTQPRIQQETQVVSQSGTQPQTQQETQVVSQAQPGTQPCTQQEIQFVNQFGTQPKTTTHQMVQSQMTQSQTSQLQGAQPQPSQPINKKGKKKKCKKKANIKFLTELGIKVWR